MPISQYSIMSFQDLWLTSLSDTSSQEPNEALFEELCKRCLITDSALRNVFRKGVEITLQLNPLSDVKSLLAFFDNLVPSDDEYFKSRWKVTESVKNRFHAAFFGHTDEVQKADTDYKFTIANDLSKTKLSDEGLFDFLAEYLNMDKGLVRVRKMLEQAYDYVLSADSGSTVLDLACFICSEPDMEELFYEQDPNRFDDMMFSLTSRFKQLVGEPHCDGNDVISDELVVSPFILTVPNFISTEQSKIDGEASKLYKDKQHLLLDLLMNMARQYDLESYRHAQYDIKTFEPVIKTLIDRTYQYKGIHIGAGRWNLEEWTVDKMPTLADFCEIVSEYARLVECYDSRDKIKAWGAVHLTPQGIQMHPQDSKERIAFGYYRSIINMGNTLWGTEELYTLQLLQKALLEYMSAIDEQSGDMLAPNANISNDNVDSVASISPYIVDAVRGRCFFDRTDDVDIDGNEIYYRPSIAPSYVRALVISDTNAIDMEHIIEMAEDVSRHASVRWEVSIKGVREERELIGTFLFDAQLILLVPNTCDDVNRIVESLKENDMPRFHRGGGIVLGAYDDEKETVRFMLSDGTLPALDKTSHELLETVPAAIIPSLYQLSFLPMMIDEGTDNNQIVQDIVHRLMLEYNQVKYSDSFLDTFLDVQGFYQSVGALIGVSASHVDKTKKKAFKSFFDRWLSSCEYTFPQLLGDIRSYGTKRNNDEAERLIASIDAMRDDMNISSNEIRCLSYNSVERLSAMGVDERMLDVMEHKLDTLSGIVSEMRTAIDQTREKID